MSDAKERAGATVSQHLAAAARLLDAVRSGKRQSDILPFLAHLRAVAAEAEAAMAKALAALDGPDGLGDSEFAGLFAAGSAHGALLGFCRSFEKDPSEHIRQACAAGEMVLAGIDVRPEHAKVIRAMQDRLAKMS